MSNEWKMPKARKGEMVLWFDGGVRDEERACPAVVLKADHSSVYLLCHGVDADFRKECVRHMDDPNAREYERISDGGFDFCFRGSDSLGNNLKPTPAKA